MTKIYELKRGDTVSLAGTVDLPAGVWGATAQVRTDKDDLLATLQVTLAPPVAPSTKHTILIVGQSGAWPIAEVLVDVRFADASVPAVVIHSETLKVRVGKEVTRA